MRYCNVLSVASTYQTMGLPFFYSLLCCSTHVLTLIYTHPLPHKRILFLSSEYWNKICKLFKKQRPEPTAGSCMPPALNYRYVIFLVCPVSPSITCPHGHSTAQAVQRVLSHMLNPRHPLGGWAIRPQDYCLLGLLFINARFRCQCTGRERLATNPTSPEESSWGLSWSRLKKHSFRPVPKLTFLCLI